MSIQLIRVVCVTCIELYIIVCRIRLIRISYVFKYVKSLIFYLCKINSQHFFNRQSLIKTSYNNMRR